MADWPALRAGQPVHRQRNPVNLTRATIPLAFYRPNFIGLSASCFLATSGDMPP